jgi:hypothetical protein
MKFTNFKHNYKPGLALEIKTSPNERAKKINQRNRADDTVICFIEVWFLQTYSLLSGHKDRVSFNPFPLSNDHLDRVSFLLNQTGHLDPSQGPPQLGVSCFDYKYLENKNGGRRKAIQATRTQMNTKISLTSH